MLKKMVETQSSCRNHPIDAIPFEAFYHGSWHGIDCLCIKNGSVSAQFDYHEHAVEDEIHTDYIRLRSRKARAFDCLHHLKPGVDICVLSAHRIAADSDQKLRKTLLSWYDAKIISVNRGPHGDRCTCLFSVMVYRSEPPTILRKSSRDRGAELVTIDKIAILQKLNSKPCEDGYYQWSSSEDCISSSKSKLLSGTFSSEISWLLVLSTLKGMDFDIKLVQNKIVYHVLNRERWPSSMGDAVSDGDSDKLSLSYDNNITVVRFQVCEAKLKPKIVSFVPVVSKEMIVSDRTIESDPLNCTLDSDSDVEILYDHRNLRHSKRQQMLPDHFISFFSPTSGRHSARNKTNDMNRLETQRKLTANASRTSKFLVEEESGSERSNCSISQSSFKYEELRSPSEMLQRKSISKGTPSEVCPEQPAVIDIETICGDQQRNTQSRMMHKGSQRRVKRGREISPSHSIDHLFPPTYQKRHSQRRKLLSAAECMQMMETCMGNIMTEMERETQYVPQRMENHPIAVPEVRLDFKWSSPSESPVDNDEHGDLWKEMEHSLTTLALLEQKQEPKSDFFTGFVNISNKHGQEPCQHDYKLNDKIGHVCQKCNFISEIRYVLPPFLQSDDWATWKERFAVKEKGWMRPNNLESDPCSEGSSWEASNFEGYDNVWTSVHVLRSKLHLHQKNAFEFIWRNIAGSLKLEEMNHLSEDTGGCVISHSPGSGKTLLVISFLISYLKLFPKIRPLILCPTIAVYIWCKEFDKWGFPFPVYQINPIESRKETRDCKIRMPSSDNRKPNRKVMHIMDCLVKLQQWHEHPSILLMSYPVFSSLAREGSQLKYRKFMADTLQKSPGILILDEGHNPRSTDSILRKRLMKVNTEFRILLSGTLFQNNFEEYFNTLSLARPRFINDAISKLDPNMDTIFSEGKKKRLKKMNLREKLARELFVEKVGQKIESSLEDERKRGFDLLNRLTSIFINTHEGDMSDILPGLQIYTLMLTSTHLQQEILDKLQDKKHRFDLEPLITVGSIHPWLIKTIDNVTQYFSINELENIEHHKGSFVSGSKAKFVIDLVHKSTGRGERVLIFSHYLSPIYLLVKFFENYFGWVIGKEILVLEGEQKLPEREKIMDNFNGVNNGRFKVLLASTAACSEGINLVAASRVVLLDSEWNHAKTRQAIARAYRPGQERIVYVYRLLASGTWEENKYNSNEWKSWLAKMILIGNYYEYSSPRQVEDTDDEILKELVEEYPKMFFQRIMKHDEILK